MFINIMNFFSKKILNKKSFILYKKIICLFLVFTFLFNLSAQAAFSAKGLVSQKVKDDLRETLSTIVGPELPPDVYIKHVLDNIEDSISESESKKSSDDADFKKLTKEDYIEQYKQQATEQYDANINSVEEQVQNALKEFDNLAEQEKQKLRNQINYPLKPFPSWFSNKNLTFEQRMYLHDAAKKKEELKEKALRIYEEGLLDVNPYEVGPEKLQVKNAKIEWEPELQEAINDVVKEKQKEEEELQQFNSKLKEQKDVYKNEVLNWQQNALSQLKEEHTKIVNQASASYNKYSTEYDKQYAELQKAEIEFYKDIIHQVVENFKKIPNNNKVATKDFLSILLYLTSIRENGIDRNKFIVGDDRTFIMNFLKTNLSKKTCGTYVKTSYDNWQSNNSCVGVCGGSPSAGKMFDVQSSKTQSLELSTPDDCEISVSSLIPYGNLNGDGFVMTNFIEKHLEEPTFGMILPQMVKALTLTEANSTLAQSVNMYSNSGHDALSVFINKAIKKENEAREKATSGVWNTLNILTLDGITNAIMFDNKYCYHNVCASTDGGWGEKADEYQTNAWETSAAIIADKGWVDILEDSMRQCEIRKDNIGNIGMRCRGIFPLLFGTLLNYPQAVNSIGTNSQSQPLVKLNNASPEAARLNNLNFHGPMVDRKNDSTNPINNGLAGLMMYNLLMPVFEDVHPANRMRMFSTVASSKYKSILDPHNLIKPYDKDSKEYKKSLNKYNAKMAVWGFANYIDFLIAIIATKDLFRMFGAMFLKTKSMINLAKMLVTFRKLPMSFGKSIKLANAFKANGFGLEFVNKLNKMRKFAKAPIKTTKSVIIERLSTESTAMIATVYGRVTGVAADGVVEGTRVAYRPISPGRAGMVYRQNALGGFYATKVSSVANIVDTAEKLSIFNILGTKLKKLWSFMNPFATKENTVAVNIMPENITFEFVNRNGESVVVKSIELVGDRTHELYVNGKLFKTFKTQFSQEQLEILNKLIAKHNIELGPKGVYIKPVWEGSPNIKEKFLAKDRFAEMVDIYDETGNVVMQIGLNRAYAQDAALLERLGFVDPKKLKNPTGPVKNNASKLVYFNNSLHIEEGGILTKIEGLNALSLPKTTFFNMASANKASFLTELFSMPSKTAGTSPLKIMTTNFENPWLRWFFPKLLFPFMVQALSYSAASSGLMLTMEKHPFDFTPTQSLLIGLALPYIFSFTAPLFSPLVSKLGARTFLNMSLGSAALGLGIAWASGYHGQGTYQTDKDDKVLRVDEKTKELWLNDDTKKHLIDKEGRLYRTGANKLPTWPLYITSLLTGFAASGVRASSNIILKGYAISNKTMVRSMMPKSIGGMAFTAIPFFFNLSAKKTGKDKDFSIAYPVMLLMTGGTMIGLRLLTPKMAVPYYNLAAKDFVRPWKLLTNPKIWPYVAGMTLACTVEGYVYFKGANAFDRNFLQKDLSPIAKEAGLNIKAEDAKFIASLLTSIPQFLIRWKAPRKSSFGYGVLNSAILTTAGTTLLLIPSDNLSQGANIALGLTGGVFIGLGTANIFQYSQQLVFKQVETLPGIPFARNDAQILYSMSNLGFALTPLFGLQANRLKDKYKEEYGEKYEERRDHFEFVAAQKTFHWPLLCYAVGIGLIFNAETNILRTIFNDTKTFLGKTTPFINPAVKYGKYFFEAGALSKPLGGNSVTFQQQTIQTPKLNLNIQPVTTPVFTIPNKNGDSLNTKFNTLPAVSGLPLQQAQTPQFSPAFSTGN